MALSVLFCGYRDWADRIYRNLLRRFSGQVVFSTVRDPGGLAAALDVHAPDLALFVGWSWIVPAARVQRHFCVCLHPSPLPRYRGGSPLQHQILRGEKESAVTLFRMNERVDTGPILWKRPFSLEGDLDVIFDRIVDTGSAGLDELIRAMLAGETIPQEPQNEAQATHFRRRTPDQSEIRLADFKECTAPELYDKIRALQDPYPNAFVVCKGATRLYLTRARIEERP